jgi:hypothetical protein
MACSTPSAPLEWLSIRLLSWRTTDNDMACNTLPYKIAALREAHQMLGLPNLRPHRIN